jgi:biotin operon repressor
MEIAMADKSQTRMRVARNFIKTYGRVRFHRLLTLLAQGISGQKIADEFNVSRERVRQWKNTFGEVVTHYRLYPEIDTILRERKMA